MFMFLTNIPAYLIIFVVLTSFCPPYFKCTYLYLCCKVSENCSFYLWFSIMYLHEKRRSKSFEVLFK